MTEHIADLLTIDEIAALFRTTAKTVRERWVHKPGFPPPKYAPSRNKRLWEAKAVLAWASRDARQ
jgi:hypothetical protein